MGSILKYIKLPQTLYMFPVLPLYSVSLRPANAELGIRARANLIGYCLLSTFLGPAALRRRKANAIGQERYNAEGMNTGNIVKVCRRLCL